MNQSQDFSEKTGILLQQFLLLDFLYHKWYKIYPTSVSANIELGVNNQFFSAPAVFSFDFSPDEFGGLARQLGFFDTFTLEFKRASMMFTLS